MIRFLLHTHLTFYRPITYPMHKTNKKCTKNPLFFYSLKVTTFHSNSVENESARTKKNLKEGCQTPLPPQNKQ